MIWGGVIMWVLVVHKRRKRGPGGGGPNNLRGGQNTLWPPIIHPHFPSISMWNRKKNHKCTKLKGKIIINVTLIWFESTGKTIPLISILEFYIISDFKMRNVIIWHWFKNLVGTWRRNGVDATSLRRIDVVTTSCTCWELGPPWPLRQYSKPCPPLNILNLGPQYSKHSYAYVVTVFKKDWPTTLKEQTHEIRRKKGNKSQRKPGNAQKFQGPK